jgi:hypothetical protein
LSHSSAARSATSSACGRQRWLHAWQRSTLRSNWETAHWSTWLQRCVGTHCWRCLQTPEVLELHFGHHTVILQLSAVALYISECQQNYQRSAMWCLEAFASRCGGEHSRSWVSSGPKLHTSVVFIPPH